MSQLVVSVFLLFINTAAHHKSDEVYVIETTVVYSGYLKKFMS
jgi:hypothetical protein